MLVLLLSFQLNKGKLAYICFSPLMESYSQQFFAENDNEEARQSLTVSSLSHLPFHSSLVNCRLSLRK